MTRGRRKTGKTALMYEIENRYQQDIQDVLVELYEKHGTLAGAAHELGIDASAFSKWLTRFDLSIERTVTRCEMAEQ